MSVELLACPFCGSSATAMRDDPHWWVECDKCGLHTPTENFTQHTMDVDPDELWNTRTSVNGEAKPEKESEPESVNAAQNRGVPSSELLPTPALDAARTIADDLFGESDRLVLSHGDEDRGRPGWSKQVVIDRIVDALADSGI